MYFGFGNIVQFLFHSTFNVTPDNSYRSLVYISRSRVPCVPRWKIFVRERWNIFTKFVIFSPRGKLFSMVKMCSSPNVNAILLQTVGVHCAEVIGTRMAHAASTGLRFCCDCKSCTGQTRLTAQFFSTVHRSSSFVQIFFHGFIVANKWRNFVPTFIHLPSKIILRISGWNRDREISRDIIGDSPTQMT